MSGFDVRRCSRKDYAEFLSVANEAFGYSAGSRWFEQNMDNCVPAPEFATDEMIAKHVIAINNANGDIMGGVGVYPFELVVSEDAPDGTRYALPALGVGQVCCLKQYRQRGVMSKTLGRALDESIADGAALGFLSGDRYRYGRFGFDYSGGELILDFNQYRLKSIINADSLVTREVSVDDAPELNEMYCTIPSRLNRDAAYWKMQLARAHFKWIIGVKDGKKAYISFDAAKKNIAETAGEPDVALSLIISHMESHGLQNVSVSLPLSPGGGSRYMEPLAVASSYARASPNSMGLSAVLNPISIYKIIKPYAERLGVVPRNDNETAELIKYLFGEPGRSRPRFISADNGIRPFIYWISKIDYV